MNKSIDRRLFNRAVFFILKVSLLTAIQGMAQVSDLKYSSHKITCQGDSSGLKSIIEYLQSDSINILPKGEEICECLIKDVGIAENIKIHVYQITMSVGISCRGVFRTVFFENNIFIGYYNSDLMTAKAIQKNQLVWSSENGNETMMDLSNGVPSEFILDGVKRFLLIPN